MKITQDRLRQIIKEELEAVSEAFGLKSQWDYDLKAINDAKKYAPAVIDNFNNALKETYETIANSDPDGENAGLDLAGVAINALTAQFLHSKGHNIPEYSNK